MQAFTEAMRFLRSNIDFATSERHAHVDKLREDTQNFLHDAHESFQKFACEFHANMAERERDRHRMAEERCNERRRFVQDHARFTHDTLRAFRDDFRGGHEAFFHHGAQASMPKKGKFFGKEARPS